MNNQRINAVATADAHLKNAGLPTYSELVHMDTGINLQLQARAAHRYLAASWARNTYSPEQYPVAIQAQERAAVLSKADRLLRGVE